ncbi:MAG: DNA-deoxyinosine glycosylase [Methanomicrobiales archaeon]|nr:DNA-deoxyinosine glycosylase [Methanomicrobiales archaeon]
MPQTPENGRYAGLPPVIGSEAAVLILGSFPSIQSLAAQEYYGNPQNQFWRIMGALDLADPHDPYPVRCRSLTSRGVALWDVIASCRREGSGDAAIRDPVPNPVPGLLAMHPGIRLVVLNGKGGAGRWFARFFPELAGGVAPRVAILPSTSPAHARLSLSAKVREWQIVSRHATT